MNQPTHGALFTALILLLIGYIAGGYCGFVVGVFWDDWMKKVVHRVVVWGVTRWYKWKDAA